MTRQIALGAVIGFALTVLVLAWWERGGSAPVPAPVDAGLQAKPLRRLELREAHDLPMVRRMAIAAVFAAMADAGLDGGL